jgi:aspartate carbamoyltransferase regulatory subunit
MKGKCVLATAISAAAVSRSRKQVYEKKSRKKPHGFKLVAACGNPRCIAYEHIQLQPWAMWGRKH